MNSLQTWNYCLRHLQVSSFTYAILSRWRGVVCSSKMKRTRWDFEGSGILDYECLGSLLIAEFRNAFLGEDRGLVKKSPSQPIYSLHYELA